MQAHQIIKSHTQWDLEIPTIWSNCSKWLDESGGQTVTIHNQR